MALWMVINVFTGLPIIFSFSLIFFSGPYMGVLTAIFAHTLLARKYYHKSSIKDLFTVHGINIFCINLVIDIAVLTSIHYAIEEHCKHCIPSFLRYIERAIPISATLFIHFILFYLLNFLYDRLIKVKAEDTAASSSREAELKSYLPLKPALGIQLLLFQLLISIYFAVVFDLTYQSMPYLAQSFCILYPVLIGTAKTFQMW